LACQELNPRKTGKLLLQVARAWIKFTAREVETD
jgi:hypothetical protein